MLPCILGILDVKKTPPQATHPAVMVTKQRQPVATPLDRRSLAAAGGGCFLVAADASLLHRLRYRAGLLRHVGGDSLGDRHAGYLVLLPGLVLVHGSS